MNPQSPSAPNPNDIGKIKSLADRKLGNNRKKRIVLNFIRIIISDYR
jgi:hypothetical protein